MLDIVFIEDGAGSVGRFFLAVSHLEWCVVGAECGTSRVEVMYTRLLMWGCRDHHICVPAGTN